MEICGVKSGRGRLRNLPSGRLGTFLLNKMRVYFQGMRVAAFTLA